VIDEVVLDVICVGEAEEVRPLTPVHVDPERGHLLDCDDDVVGRPRD